MRYRLENSDYYLALLFYYVMSCGLDIFQLNSFRKVWAIYIEYSQYMHYIYVYSSYCDELNAILLLFI